MGRRPGDDLRDGDRAAVRGGGDGICRPVVAGTVRARRLRRVDRGPAERGLRHSVGTGDRAGHPRDGTAWAAGRPARVTYPGCPARGGDPGAGADDHCVGFHERVSDRWLQRHSGEDAHVLRDQRGSGGASATVRSVRAGLVRPRRTGGRERAARAGGPAAARGAQQRTGGGVARDRCVRGQAVRLRAGRRGRRARRHPAGLPQLQCPVPVVRRDGIDHRGALRRVGWGGLDRRHRRRRHDGRRFHSRPHSQRRVLRGQFDFRLAIDHCWREHGCDLPAGPRRRRRAGRAGAPTAGHQADPALSSGDGGGEGAGGRAAPRPASRLAGGP